MTDSLPSLTPNPARSAFRSLRSVPWVIGIFLLFLLVRWEIVASPPYFDYAVGIWREAEYLARSNFNYYSLRYECEPGISEIGGPRCYLITIVPGCLALLFRLFPGTLWPVIIYHLLVFLAAAWTLVALYRLLTPRVGKAMATAAAFAFATTPVYCTQIDMLGFEVFLNAFVVAWLMALDRQQFIRAGLISLFAFSIKATGSILTMVLIAYLFVRIVVSVIQERRFPARLTGSLLFAMLILGFQQLALWWSGAFEQQQGGRLPLTMALAWFPDVLILVVVAIVGLAFLEIRARTAEATTGVWQRWMNVVAQEPAACSAALALLLLGAAMSSVRFVPRYAAFAVPFLFLLLPLVLVSVFGRNRFPAILLFLLGAINLVNWNGILFPDEGTALERFAHLPRAALRREGSILERSHEYLPNHRANLAAVVAASKHDGPVVTSMPFANYLAMPELGVVAEPKTVYCFYPVGPEHISRMKSLADFEHDRPKDFIAIRDVITFFYAFTKAEIPRPEESSALLFTDASEPDLQVYRQEEWPGEQPIHQEWLDRAKSLPTLAWLRLWSAHDVAGGGGAYSVAKELTANKVLEPDAQMILTAGAARIGQWQELISLLLAAEARTGILSDQEALVYKPGPPETQPLTKALNALLEGHDQAAGQWALDSCLRDAPYLRPPIMQYQTALAMLDEGNGHDAAPLFRQLLKHLPQFWPAELGLAKASLAKKDYPAAKAMLEKIIAAVPSAEEPRRLLALLIAETEPESSEAAKLLADYLKTYPTSPKVRECLVRIQSDDHSLPSATRNQ